jgi:hypothetical protein
MLVHFNLGNTAVLLVASFCAGLAALGLTTTRRMTLAPFSLPKSQAREETTKSGGATAKCSSCYRQYPH